MVFPPGVEPGFPASEASVISIRRREHTRRRPGWNRTTDPSVISAVLLPTELLAHSGPKFSIDPLIFQGKWV